MKIVLFLLSIACFGQEFVAIKTTTLSSAAEAITIQMPASSAPARVNFRGVWISTTVDVTITVERSGTAATSTTLAIAAVNTGTALARAWSSSNVGTGTLISSFTCLATASPCSVDLTRTFLLGAGTTKNLTVRTSSISGTVTIGIQWAESL